MFKLSLTFNSDMQQEESLNDIIAESIIPAVAEIKVVFDDKAYLEDACNSILGTHITGYNITEQKATYIWDGKKCEATNYTATTVVAPEQLRTVVAHLYKSIAKRWKTPLIQVIPCIVNQSFYAYLYSLIKHAE
ncbi:hypothetical protein HY485_00730 [Candidatus Woesearchaeota archaeon]|nr:hypothetical protein [Candidatus Woesearchaeota archaeon]